MKSKEAVKLTVLKIGSIIILVAFLFAFVLPFLFSANNSMLVAGGAVLLFGLVIAAIFKIIDILHKN